MLRETRNSSRSKGAGAGGPPKPTGTSPPSAPSTDGLICTRECLLYASPANGRNSAHHQPPPPPCSTPMYMSNDFTSAGTTTKKAGTQRIPIGRPPTYAIRPLPECGIPTPTPRIPTTEIHGWPWRTQTRLPRKTPMPKMDTSISKYGGPFKASPKQ